MNNWTNNNPEYTKYTIPEFSNHPLVEAINPPPYDNNEALVRLIQKPQFSIQERDEPQAIRMFLPARLNRFMFPTSQHTRFLNTLYAQVFDGYRMRNPITAAGQEYLHNPGAQTRKHEPIIDTANHRPGTVSFLTGISGMGKTTLVRACAKTLGKPVINHSEYNGLPFCESQILYLMRNVPDQCSAKALCKSFGSYTDSLLGEDLYSQSFNSSKLTRTDYIEQLRHIIVNHHVSILIIDEFQNLSLSKSGGAKELVALIVNLRDQLGIPILLVGTPKAESILKSDMSTARRLVDGGFHTLKRPETHTDKDWRQLCSILWRYQWVRNPQENLDDNTAYKLYDYSQGVTAILINLFVRAQMEAIETGAETVNEKILNTVYNEYLKPLHKFLQVLRSGDKHELGKYDDLYLDAQEELKEDSTHAQLEAIKKDLNQRDELELGIASEKENSARENTNSPTKSNKKLNLSASEILSIVKNK
jgi:ABC-type iron transport system FetAB ATPase subunit